MVAVAHAVGPPIDLRSTHNNKLIAKVPAVRVKVMETGESQGTLYVVQNKIIAMFASSTNTVHSDLCVEEQLQAVYHTYISYFDCELRKSRCRFYRAASTTRALSEARDLGAISSSMPAAELEKKCGEGFPIILPPCRPSSRSISSSSCGGYQIDAMEIAATSIQIPFGHYTHTHSAAHQMGL